MALEVLSCTQKATLPIHTARRQTILSAITSRISSTCQTSPRGSPSFGLRPSLVTCHCSSHPHQTALYASASRSKLMNSPLSVHDRHCFSISFVVGWILLSLATLCCYAYVSILASLSAKGGASREVCCVCFRYNSVQALNKLDLDIIAH